MAGCYILEDICTASLVFFRVGIYFDLIIVNTENAVLHKYILLNVRMILGLYKKLLEILF